MIDTIRFLKAFVKARRETGAIAPSSGRLANAMLDRVGDIKPGQVIIELGPGTGPITKHILRRYPDNPLIAIEFNQQFVNNLQRKYPQGTFVQGCASKILDHVKNNGYERADVGAIVSGLPLLSLPKELGQAIFGSINDALDPGRRYVQFTYSKRSWRNMQPDGFKLETHKRIFINLPPAVVLPFTRK